MRHLVGDERPQQRKVRRIQNLLDVDAAGIGGRKMRLPGEVLATTSWLGQEVSRGHSTCGKRGAREMHRSHKQGRTERNKVLNIHRNLFSQIALNNENRFRKELITNKMIEQVVQPHNLQKALKHVISNKGSAGVDGIKTTQLKTLFPEIREQLLLEVKQETYLPQPILGVAIPKGKGKMRLLGIPTTIDRVLQQAVSQAIAPRFEFTFNANSFGFRPDKNARQAVGQALTYIHQGLNYIVDIDLKTFFDEVDHCLLLNLIYQKVKCKTTMRLIRKWLKVPIKINGKLQKRHKGVPQGSPLSPLLSNILLHELDKKMMAMKLKFVRYADDFSIYCKSRNEANAISKYLIKFLKTKLKLTINQEKSGIRRPVNFTILGFGFVPTYQKGSKNQYQLVVAEKALNNLKVKLKSITRKTAPTTFDARISKINEVQRGWLTYFQGTSVVGKLKSLDGWLRNRLRYCIWHDWKKPERKRKNLIRLGATPDHAYAWSRTRKGGWAIAQSPILGTTITLNRLKKRGYISLMEMYIQLNPSYCEPPST